MKIDITLLNCVTSFVYKKDEIYFSQLQGCHVTQIEEKYKILSNLWFEGEQNMQEFEMIEIE